MTLSILPNPLVKKKSFNASFSSKCTTGTATASTVPESNDAEEGTTVTKKEKTDNLNVSAETNSPLMQNPTLPPHHGYPHPGYPGMMPMAPGMGMLPMFMMPPMPMGCYSYNCEPFPHAYGRVDGGSRCSSSRRSRGSGGGWFYGGHPDITEIDVEDGVSFDSRESCATLMCVEPLEQAGQLITKVLDSWASNVNTAMDYGENLCHPVDTNQTNDSNAVKKESGLSETLLNLVKGQEENEEAVMSQNEKNVDVPDEVKVQDTVQTADGEVNVQAHNAEEDKTKKLPSGDMKENKEQCDDVEKVKKVQPVRFFQRMKNLNPLKTLDMSAISKDSEVNDLSGKADVDVVVSEVKTQEAGGPVENLDETNTGASNQKKNYFLNEFSFEFSPEGVSIQEVVNEIQPEEHVVDTNPIKVVTKNEKLEPPIVASIVCNAKTASKRPEKKMMKFPRVNSRYSRLGAKEESKIVEEQPFIPNFPADAALDSNGFPILSRHNSKSPTWECSFSNINPFASGYSTGMSSPVTVAEVFETRSCAWCGKGGNDTAAARKLKLCSACQSTYYCSAVCQSKDWIDGHSKTCQPIIETADAN